MFVNTAPAQAMMLGWEIVAVYKYEATCHQMGRLWLDAGRARPGGPAGHAGHQPWSEPKSNPPAIPAKKRANTICTTRSVPVARP